MVADDDRACVRGSTIASDGDLKQLQQDPVEQPWYQMAPPRQPAQYHVQWSQQHNRSSKPG